MKCKILLQMDNTYRCHYQVSFIIFMIHLLNWVECSGFFFNIPVPVLFLVTERLFRSRVETANECDTIDDDLPQG